MTCINANYQAASRTIRIPAQSPGHPISYAKLTMISGSLDPDIGIPDIEPDIEPDIGSWYSPISEYSISNPILNPISGIEYPIMISCLDVPISGPTRIWNRYDRVTCDPIIIIMGRYREKSNLDIGTSRMS